MRILQICSAKIIGGGERHLADLSNSLAANGHQVFLALSKGSPLAGSLTNIPAENLYHFSLRNALDISSAIKIYTISKRLGVDIIHAHIARDYPVAALASRLSGIPLVLTRHVLFPMKRLQKLMLRHASGVIAPSLAIYEALRKDKIFDEKIISHIEHGIDIDHFSGFPKIPHDGINVGSVGHLDPIKGFDILIDAAKIVAAERDDISFTIAGEDKSRDGRNRKFIEQKIVELGLHEKIRLDGWVDDIRPTFAKLDIFVSAARQEPFGLVMGEAMASGIPVIATRSEGATEFVEDGVSGLLVPLEDPEALAAAILKLASDTSLQTAFVNNAADRVRELFSIQRMVSQTEEFYRSIIKE